MAIDQAYEQNNKLVKIDGDTIGILENDTSLLNWAISGVQISQMLQIFSNSDTNLVHMLKLFIYVNSNILLKIVCLLSFIYLPNAGIP